jgi:hypothetical protein
MESGTGRNSSASVTAESRGHESEVVIRMPNVVAWLRDQVPDEFVTHMRAARREQLLAVRSLIDRAIERTERSESQSRSRRRIEIEVD